MWPVPLITILWFAPESPWWLVRRGRPEEAKVALQRLSSNKTDEEIDDTVNSMCHKNLFLKSSNLIRL